MNSFSFKTFFRFLGKNKLYSAINIFGFAVSLAFVLLIADFTVRQLTTDHFQKNADQVYILGNEHYFGSNWLMAPRLLSRYPEIAQICATCIDQAHNTPIEVEGRKSVAHMLFADTTFFDLFSFKLLSGDPRQALASKENVVITKSYARQLFGDQSPLGRTIVFTGENTSDSSSEGTSNPPVSRTVSGVMEDIDNSLFPNTIQLITQMANVGNYNSAMVSEYMNNAGSAILFIRVHPNTSLPDKIPDMLSYFKEFFWPYEGNAWKEVTLTPMKEAFFSPLNDNGLSHGDKSFVLILLTIGLLILLFAVINYVNLTVSQTSLRAKEMATRRLLGANQSEIFRRFMLESILLCFLSFALAFVLALLLQPMASSLLQTNVNIWQSLNGARILSYVGAVLLLGALSGLAPAGIITRFKPIDVVRGNFRVKSKMVFSKVFIIFQNVITIALIAGCLTIYLQINHLIKAPLGYDYEGVLDISTSGFKSLSQLNTFKNEISQLAGVQKVSFSCGTPLNRGNNNTTPVGTERMISFQILIADSTFFSIFNLEKIRENYATDPFRYYMNQEALRQLELDEDARTCKWGREMETEVTIAGVYKDFQLGDILNKKEAVLLYELNDFAHGPYGQPVYPWNVLVKVTGDPFTTFEAIKQCFETTTQGEIMNAEYMDEQIKHRFEQQQNLATIVLVFTCMAVLISALGLLAMSTYFIQQRRREIALRKVFGATRREVLLPLLNTFMGYVLIAFMLAIPVIWYVMEWWLKDYTYRIVLSPWIFLAAGVFTLLIALITVLWQSLKASATNPVEAVKI